MVVRMTVTRPHGPNSIEALLSSAKEAWLAGNRQHEGADKQHQNAAQLLAQARDLGVTHRRMADALGIADGAVCEILKWFDGGCVGTVYGSRSAESRRRRKAGDQSPEQKTVKRSSAEWQAADAARARAQMARDEAAAARAEAAKARAETSRARAEALKARHEAAAAKARRQAAHERAEEQLNRMFEAGIDGGSNLPNFDERTRSLLIKTLGIFGSDHRGEQEAAGEAAERIRRKLGVMWGDLIVPAHVDEDDYGEVGDDDDDE